MVLPPPQLRSQGFLPFRILRHTEGRERRFQTLYGNTQERLRRLGQGKSLQRRLQTTQILHKEVHPQVDGKGPQERTETLYRKQKARIRCPCRCRFLTGSETPHPQKIFHAPVPPYQKFFKGGGGAFKYFFLFFCPQFCILIFCLGVHIMLITC